MSVSSALQSISALQLELHQKLLTEHHQVRDGTNYQVLITLYISSWWQVTLVYNL